VSDLSHEVFSQNLRTKFKVCLRPDRELEVELVGVSGRKLSSHTRAAQRVQLECFAITFCGSSSQPLAQGIYQFEHDRIGPFDLFIVPIGMDQGSYLYEAVFNRLVQPEKASSPGEK
jgi:hypothetical protein